MNLALALALYFMIWWIVLFAVLPFGVHTQGESGNVVPGTPASAPAATHMIKIFLVNSLLAAVVFALVWSAVEYDWLGLRGPAVPPTP